MQLKFAEKQREQIRHEYIKKQIKTDKVLVCFVTKRFAKQRERYEECDLAVSLNRLMYAVVRKGTRWKKFEKYPWRKIYWYEQKEELGPIMRDIYADISLYKATGGS